MKDKKVGKRLQFHREFRYRMLPGVCLAAFLCAECVCAGCGVGLLPNNGTGGEEARIIAMESTPVIDYAVPHFFPNILVDRNGYRIDGPKRAGVKGRKLPESFDLVDARTGKIVFTGELEEMEYNAEQDIYSAYADFHEWKQEGSYYLQCDYVGRSYTFTLADGLYDSSFQRVSREMTEECKKQNVTIADVERMLLAYEWYEQIFPDESGNGIPDFLETVADWIEATAEQQGAAGEQKVSYAAALARFSFLYQKYDKAYATECLKRASVVFEQAQNGIQEDAECFHALTELYRATGLETYNNQIISYKTYFESHSGYASEEGYLYGAMTYMNTRQAVDVELCVFFMEALMKEGEDISMLYDEMTHPVNARNNGTSDLLGHAVELACANYVMNNYRYNYVMEEFLHYLRGSNPESVDFYELEPENKSRYLILMAQLAAVQEKTAE